MKKKWLILLSVCLLFILMPVSAFAEDQQNENDRNTVKYTPGGTYIYTEIEIQHTQRVRDLFDFVEGDIAYKIVDESEKTVEVAPWQWEWACNHNGHTQGTYITSEYVNREGGITVPGSVKYKNTDYTVVGIGTNAFENVTGTNVTLPDTLQYIDGSAFYGFNCGDNGTLTVPASVASLGEHCFTNCTAAVQFADNSQLKTIGNNAFAEYKGNLTELVLPTGLESIASSAFSSCTFSLTIPATVTDFDITALTGYGGGFDKVTFKEGAPANFVKQDGVLSGNGAVITVFDKTITTCTIPEGVTSIGDQAFSGCSNLTIITLPDSLQSIGDSAFSGCSALTTVEGGSHLTSVGRSAFQSCSKLESIDISNIESIGNSAFKDCAALNVEEWPNNLETLGSYAFQNCTSLDNIVISGSITEIPTSAFNGCYAVKTVSLPEGLTTIGANAFQFFKSTTNAEPVLESINIPSSVTEIGNNFLSGAKANGETALIFEGDNPPDFATNALNQISGEGKNKPTVYYPAGAEEAYIETGSALVTSGLISASSEGQEDDQAMSLSVSPASGSVQVGQTATFTVTHSPAAANVTVTNSNDTVATASMDGNTLSVTGQSVGSTVVTLHLQINGYEVMTKDITVTVTAAPSLTLNRDTASLYWNTQNNTLQLNATLTGATDTVVWTSSDESVATVDENGLVTAHRPGTAVITASAGDLSDSCTVTVSTYVSPSPDPTPTPEPEPETPDVTTDDNAGTTETTAKPDVTVSGGTASATVSDEMGEEIVNQATENDSATVIIAPEMDDDVTSTEVTLPSATVDSIGADTNADIVISTPVADVTLPNGGLSDLASAGGDITVSASVDGNTVKFTVTANGEPVTEVTGGVTLVVPASDTTAGTVAVIVYDDGTREVVRKSVAGDDSVTIPLSGSATVEIIDNSKDFDDVSAGAWYSDVVDFASSHELFNGTSATTFSPNDAMTRGMLAAVLANLESADVSGMQSAFNDVHDEEWYSESVAWAAENGIVNGYGDGAFGPNDAITREQLAAMLYNYADMLGLDTTARVSLAGYNDQPSAWATDVMQWAVAEGLITGTSSDTLDPQGTATRAQVAAMLQRFIENVL